MSTPYDAMPLAALSKILDQVSAAYRAREAADAASKAQRDLVRVVGQAG